jgi:hypothetical protein
MFPARHHSTTGTAMSATLIISTLRDKRLEVADAIERLERQADPHRADLAHLEATMRARRQLGWPVRIASPKIVPSDTAVASFKMFPCLASMLPLPRCATDGN